MRVVLPRFRPRKPYERWLQGRPDCQRGPLRPVVEGIHYILGRADWALWVRLHLCQYPHAAQYPRGRVRRDMRHHILVQMRRDAEAVERELNAT